MRVLTYLPLAGRVGLFLYGITLLGESLERAAGAKLSRLLRRDDTGTLAPHAAGALRHGGHPVVHGRHGDDHCLVNGGILGLEQAAGIIFGANIGTTATACCSRFRSCPGVGL